MQRGTKGRGQEVIGDDEKLEEMTLKPYVEESDSLLDMDGKSVNKVLRECEAWAVAISRAIKQSRDKGPAVGAGGHATDQNAGRRYSTSGRPLDAKLIKRVDKWGSKLLESGKSLGSQMLGTGAEGLSALDELVA